ncbi:hypothetical protein IGI37_001982 [Enterococcus sp. AZ194]|uniref:Gfo/Idh/MocA family protein n=1 Tax=Enterococcus sp. AZ194 TaxID=2774629 RepID=UPI003F227D80
MLKVAMLSRWHVHADDYAQQVQANPDMEIVAVWDEVQTRGLDWAKELEVPFYENLDKLLQVSEIDAVVVVSPTNMHREIILQAVEAGKHVFTEKVLGLTVDECDQILEAVQKHQVELMVSLPRLTENYYVLAQKTLDEGKLGDLTTIRCRLAHDGAVPTMSNPQGWLPAHFFDKEVCGGGAFIDLGAHPIYLTNRLAGPATTVSATLKSTSGRSDVDDNSVVVVEYASGAIGILETGFLSAGSPFQLELYGTKGTLLVEGEKVRLLIDGQEEVLTEKLALPSPLEQWLDEIKRINTPTLTATDFRALTQINEAAAESNKTGKKVSIS